MTNQEFAKNDEVFRTACGLVGLEPTPRQASKFRNGKGLAFRVKRQAIKNIAEFEKK